MLRSWGHCCARWRGRRASPLQRSRARVGNNARTHRQVRFAQFAARDVSASRRRGAQACGCLSSCWGRRPQSTRDSLHDGVDPAMIRTKARLDDEEGRRGHWHRPNPCAP
eukprot:7603693-Lingulodinium_polyedra.AAC.1